MRKLIKTNRAFSTCVDVLIVRIDCLSLTLESLTLENWRGYVGSFIKVG